MSQSWLWRGHQNQSHIMSSCCKGKENDLEFTILTSNNVGFGERPWYIVTGRFIPGGMAFSQNQNHTVTPLEREKEPVFLWFKIREHRKGGCRNHPTWASLKLVVYGICWRLYTPLKDEDDFINHDIVRIPFLNNQDDSWKVGILPNKYPLYKVFL